MGNLNSVSGLFKVADGFYQVRGADLANMTIIEGKTGIIVIDSLMSTETATAALDFYFTHRPKRPVVALVYSHSHVDHFGGSQAVARFAQSPNELPVIAPSGFMEEAVAENVTAGPAMNRRMQFQFATAVPPGPKGRVDAGLGKTISTGTVALLPPNDYIKQKRERRIIDGVQIEFLLTPGAEAPAEMVMYFPQFKILNTSEIVTPLMHNLYAIRGAEVRSGALWSGYISEMLENYGGAEVVIAQHHWPKWGTSRVREYLEQHRDMYKYIHDQSVRLMNQGYTAEEIAERVQLPKSIGGNWMSRGYYGALSHNLKAQYQKYLGWHDGHPASLNPLPPNETAKKFVEYMGGPEKVIAQAEKDLQAGNYRWVAQVLRHVVYAYPENRRAKDLQATSFEQMAYQSESSIWRNAYLQGAWELRN